MLHRHRIPAPGRSADTALWSSWEDDTGPHSHRFTLDGTEYVSAVTDALGLHSHAIFADANHGTTSMPYYDNPPSTDPTLCAGCRTPIYLSTFRDCPGSRSEPDYDPNDDPVTWRHAGGYARCPHSGFATPPEDAPPPIPVDRDLIDRSKRTAVVPLSIQVLNRVRCDRWHGPDDDWTLGDWANAFQGEAGELGNVVKKMRRHALGVATAYNTPELDDLRARFADEVADVRLYLDLLCWKAGVTDELLDEALIAKFNLVSRAQGWEDLTIDLPEGWTLS